jgi:hypothetical protein
VLAVALLVRPARAAEGPLLVVVEAPPALEADAAEIRRAISTELHARAIAPMSTPAEVPGRALIVALDRDRIVMSLRANDGTSVARVIPAPGEHAARLRAIVWLAGNLARDQVSAILAEAPPEASPLAAIPTLPVTSAATEPPSAATGPPPKLALPSTAASASGTGETLSIRAQPQPPPGPLRWSISGSIGPVIADVERSFGATWSSLGFQPSTAWQIAVQRRREHERLVIGGRLEGTYNHSGNGQGPQLLGAELFVGSDWRFRHFTLEATIGAGPEAANILQHESIAYGYPTMNTTYYFSTYHFDFYAQGAIAAAIPLGGSMEGLLQLGVHLNSSYADNWFAASTIGVRYTLP